MMTLSLEKVSDVQSLANSSEVIECHIHTYVIDLSKVKDIFLVKNGIDFDKHWRKKHMRYANHIASVSIHCDRIQLLFLRVPYTKILMQKFENNNNNWFASQCTFTISQSCMISIEKVSFSLSILSQCNQPHIFPTEKLIYVTKSYSLFFSSFSYIYY